MCLLGARNFTKCFTCLSAFNPYNEVATSIHILQMRRLWLQGIKENYLKNILLIGGKARAQTWVCLTVTP
jgi:hypothetical protein